MENRFAKLKKIDIKKRKREGLIILAIAIIIVFITYFEIHISNLSSKLPLSNNVLVFSLININIILLTLLIFLVLRNFVKIFFELRTGVLGSKIRTKLVSAFVALSLVPTFLLFFIAIGFITRSIEGWFGIGIERSLGGALQIARSYYNDTSDKALYYAREISKDVEEKELFNEEMLGSLTVYLEGKLRENNLSSLEMYAVDGTRVLNIVSSNITPSLLPVFSQDLLGKGLKGEDVFRIETTDVGDIVRAISPVLRTDGNKVNSVIGVVGVSYHIPANLVANLQGISAAFKEYEQLKVLKNPIKISYFITLLIITLVIVFLATWVGIYMSKGITIPIQNLAKGTHAVASGNLDYHIPGESDDEVGVLVKSFNQMTANLKISNARLGSTYTDLRNTNLELDQRRKYMEIILKNVAAGVVSLDKVGAITTINKAAEEMFAIDTGQVLGKNYKEVLKGEHLDFLKDMIREMNSLGIKSIERQIKLDADSKSITMMVNLTLLNDDDGKYIGMVAVFDDISHLLKVQRMTAWREIARRIAHEIKNPLTPIQLSAQRLRRKYGDKFADDGMIFDECTKTIINQVEELKVLVNEFSNFARMPTANPIPNDLNKIVKEAVALYQGGHKNIEFQYLYDDNMPIISIDRDQIKRAVINLLDNSVDAIEGEGTIEVKTSYNPELEIAKIEVTDSGCGISQEDKEKLFEPYFSTKKSGTGLGLAILNNIVADHQGYVRVLDNFPSGTKFIIALNAKASSYENNHDIEGEKRWQATS